MLAVVSKFRNRLANIIQCPMRIFFLESICNAGAPTPDQLFERADVEISIVEIRFQSGHVARKESSILANTVSTERRPVFGDKLLEEFDRFALCLAFRDFRIKNPLC